MKAIIYGASGAAKKAYSVWHSDYEITAFVDNDIEKQGKELYGLPVRRPDYGELREYVVIMGTANRDVFKECIRNGVSIIPYECTRKLYALEGGEEWKDVPIVSLTEKEVKDCRLVADRETILEKLPGGGIICEAGVFRAQFSRKILDICKPKKLYLIDIWEGPMDGYAGEENYEYVKEKLKKEMEEGIVELIRSDSVSALEKMPDGFLDFIYLDTCHNYSVPRAELQLAKRKVKENGRIGGHDYTNRAYSNGGRYGVKEAVNEFCRAEGWWFEYLTCEPGGHDSYVLRRI